MARFAFLVAATLVLPAWALAQALDTTAPQLTALTLTPTTVDVSSSLANLRADYHG